MLDEGIVKYRPKFMRKYLIVLDNIMSPHPTTPPIQKIKIEVGHFLRIKIIMKDGKRMQGVCELEAGATYRAAYECWRYSRKNQ